MQKLDLIRENLYLGDICAAAEILKNVSSEISHVLTVLHCPSISVFEEWRNVKLDSKEIKEVYVGDDDDHQGGEFATENALASLKQSAHVRPNPGFLKQLDLFERMNFKVDRSSPIYKHFRLKTLGYLYSKDKRFDKLKLRADPGMSNEGSGSTYQCKKCKNVLLFQEQVINHATGEADLEFDDMFKNMMGEVHSKHPGDQKNCTSMFVEPLYWMNEAVEDDVSEGKLLCPKCKARLGSFDWLGSFCSCGSKIVPEFQIQMSRVDVIPVKDDVKKKKKNVKHEKKRV